VKSGSISDQQLTHATNESQQTFLLRKTPDSFSQMVEDPSLLAARGSQKIKQRNKKSIYKVDNILG
jgi:hypothetical protein